MDYAHPEVLVSTQWVQEHAQDENVRVLEVDEDILLYEQGHVPGAQKLDWQTDLQENVQRDFIDEAGFEALMGRLGISEGTTVVLYGDKNNWWAAYAFWFFKYNGHEDARLMNGGRQKWLAEGRELSKGVPSYSPTSYRVPYRDASIRAFRDDVLKHLPRVDRNEAALVDVRSPDEYSGKLSHMANYPQEGALRAGHIPGAVSVPWALAANEDGTFRTPEELERLYGTKAVTPDKDVIVYCRIAERSSHTWFVLRYLLGFRRVRNYDGSWTEWGNLVGAPIEKSV
ncbi:MAG TPA: sulfurtransferase [Deinococcales bacterium]|nr:sulfurtransferase [Deinococcales bacterium]